MSPAIGRAPLPRLETLVAEIELALASGDPARQSELVLRSAEVLTRRWSRLAPDQKPAFDRLLIGLLGQVDEAARAAFARHLAPLRRAPRLTVTFLARDPSAKVFAPLLATCPSFDEPWLLDVVAGVGQAHRRVIAGRPAVGAALGAALVRAGEPAVAAALLLNPGAAIPQDVVPDLLRMAERSEPLGLALAAWPDLAAPARAELVALARERALADLRAGEDIDGTTAEDLLAATCAAIDTPASPERVTRCTGSAAVATADAFFGAGPVNPARLERWIGRYRIEDALVAIARDAGLPVRIVVACLEIADPRALALVLHGLGHPWSVTKAMMRARPGGVPKPEAVLAAYRLHENVSPVAARRVLRYAAARIGLAAFAAIIDDSAQAGESVVPMRKTG